MKNNNKKNTINVIGFDADDTLWENEIIFVNCIKKYNNFLAKYLNKNASTQNLLKIEEFNLKYYGYGIKGFVLSLIENTLQEFDKKLDIEIVKKILDLGKEMISEPVKILPNVVSTLKQLSKDYTLILITKGDLFDQEKKVKNSNLANYFNYIEIVSEKTEIEYIKILDKYKINPKNFLMVGNSLKSDILPVKNLGANGVHIPSKFTWEHEKVKIEKVPKNLITLNDISMLIPFLKKI